MSRKYKHVIQQYQNKLDEVQQELEHLQHLQRPLPMISHNAPLRPADSNHPEHEHFQQQQNNYELSNNNTPILQNTMCSYEPVPQPVKKSVNMDHLMDNNLNTSIDKLLQEQRNNQFSSEINGYDTVWRGSNLE